MIVSVNAEELQRLQSECARMRDLLDRRPAFNAGLVEAYVKWSSLCYASDAASVANAVGPPTEYKPR